MSSPRLVRVFFAVPLAFAVAASASAQTTYYVNGTCGNDAWTGLSPVCQAPDGPKATIQSGIFAAFYGDTVVVADGVYTGAGNKDLGLGNGVVLRSQNGAASCIIDCEDLGRGFTFPGGEGPETVVDGFTVTNGRAYSGGAVMCYYNSAPSISNCVFSGNTETGDGGGGIYCTIASPTITNCVIRGNTAPYGGGIYCINSWPTITNCTIVGNTASGSGGAVHASAISSPVIASSILWGNGPDEIYVDAGSAISVSYSDVQGGWGGVGNVASDPLFWNPGSGNLHLVSGSPCVDAGDRTAVALGIFADLNGRARFVDDPNTIDTGLGPAPVVDMGAYELQVATKRLRNRPKAGAPSLHP